MPDTFFLNINCELVECLSKATFPASNVDDEKRLKTMHASNLVLSLIIPYPVIKINNDDAKLGF